MKLCKFCNKKQALHATKCFDCKWKGRLNIHNWNDIQTLIGKKYVTKEIYYQKMGK